MKTYSLMTIIFIALTSLSAQAEVGLADVEIYHKSVIQVGHDLQGWLTQSKAGVRHITGKSADLKACYKGKGSHYCERAVEALFPYSVIPLKDGRIFELEKKLREANFEFEVGFRIFKLSAALRFFVKQEAYNGVPAPSRMNATAVKNFVAEIQKFHTQKDVELKKGRSNIPPLPAKTS